MEDAGWRALPMIKAPGGALLRVLGGSLPRVGVCLLRLRGSGRNDWGAVFARPRISTRVKLVIELVSQCPVEWNLTARLHTGSNHREPVLFRARIAAG